MKRLLLGAAIVAILAPNAFGQVHQVPNDNTDEIISIGQRIGGTEISKLTAPTSVLTEADIAARGQQHVSELLRSIPGIAVSATGSAGQITQIRVRGSEGNHVLVLIDGIEVATPTNGEFDFAGLRAADIVRIEALRGEQSAIYGSDAISGVINIITRAGSAREGWRASVEAGSFGTVDGQISAVIPVGGASLSLNANAFNTEGYDLSGSDDEDEGSNSTSFNVGLNGVKLGGAQLSAKVGLMNREADLGGPFDSIGDTIDVETFTARVDARFDLAGFEHLITGQAVNTDSDTDSSSFPFRSISERLNANWAAKRSFGNSQITLLGEAEQEHYELSSSNLETPNNVAYALASDYAYNRGPITITGSARYDINDLFDDQVTWRAGAGYAFENFGGRLRGSIGTGVKNPTLFELFGFFPQQNFTGNPDLQAETSLGYSVGYTQKIGGVNFSIDYFRSELENEIANINGTLDNLDTDSTREGVEIEAQWDVADNLSLRGAATFLDTEQDDVTEVRRAEFIGSASATYSPVDALRITATLDYNDEQLDTDFSTFPAGIATLDSFTLVGLNAAYDINEHVTVSLRGDNLFDEDYQEVLNFEGQGRAIYGGLNLDF